MLPIIDTHQHLWDLSVFDMPWLEDAPTLNRSFVTSDYLAATAGLNVVKTVYMEVDVSAAQKIAEAEHLIELCAAGDNWSNCWGRSARGASTSMTTTWCRSTRPRPSATGS